MSLLPGADTNNEADEMFSERDIYSKKITDKPTHKM
jgi:hypothetical protein